MSLYAYSSAIILLLSIAGITTSLSDIKERKIYNNTLLILSLTTLLIHLWFYLSIKTIPWLLITSTLTALIAGFACLLYKVWRPGDAKLFILYAFLMPVTEYDTIFKLPCISLFIHAFLIGLIFLIPALIQSIFLNWHAFLKHLLRIKTLKNLAYSFCITSIISWTIFPLFSLFKIPPVNPLVMSIVFILYRKIFHLTPTKVPFKIFTFFFITGGFILHAWNSSTFLSWTKISNFLMWMIPFSIASQIINDLSLYMKDRTLRIPFSPFLLAGSALSYTPILLWLMKAIHR